MQHLSGKSLIGRGLTGSGEGAITRDCQAFLLTKSLDSFHLFLRLSH